MEPWIVVLLIVAVVGVLIVASKSKKKEIAYETPAWQKADYRWRGEKGSSGNPDFKHSSNCECHMCLYHHDPNNRGCKCRVCTDPESFYGG